MNGWWLLGLVALAGLWLWWECTRAPVEGGGYGNLDGLDGLREDEREAA